MAIPFDFKQINKKLQYNTEYRLWNKIYHTATNTCNNFTNSSGSLASRMPRPPPPAVA